MSEHPSGSANDLNNINSLGVKDDRVAVNLHLHHSLVLTKPLLIFVTET